MSVYGSKEILINDLTSKFGTKVITISNQTPDIVNNYGVRFTTSHKRFSGGNTRIDFLKKNYVGSPITIRTGAQPLVITTDSSIDDIFQNGTIGSGAAINIAVSGLTAFELFTEDPQLFMVKVFDESNSSKVTWQGFVNAQIYQEDYSSSLPKNVITINCNCGMNLLDEIYYQNLNGYPLYGAPYKGTATFGKIINQILQKLNIKFNYIYTNTDLQVSGTESNIFTGLILNQDNFIDESKLIMSCRETLNTILQGLNLTMRFIGDNIYIYDPICLNNTLNNINYGKIYDLLNFTPTGITTIGGYLDVTGGTVSWFQTGQNLDLQQMTTLASVKYDPYTITNGTDGFNYDFNDINNLKTPTDLTSYNNFEHIQVTDNDYYRNHSVKFNGWKQGIGLNVNGAIPNPNMNHFIGIKEASDADPQYAIYLGNRKDYISYTITGSTAIYPDQNLSLKITIDAYLQTKTTDNSNGGNFFVPNPLYQDNIFSTTKNFTNIYLYAIKFGVIIGNQFWGSHSSSAKSWGNQSIDAFDFFTVRQADVTSTQYATNSSLSQVANVWTTTSTLIPITSTHSLKGGNITFYLIDDWDNLLINFAAQITAQDNVNIVNRKLLIKNLKIDIVDTAGNSITNEGVEVKGTPSTNIINNVSYRINPVEISTKVGSGTYGTSRGSTKDINNNNIILSNYQSPTDSAKIILQAFLSQYKQPRFIMNGNLNVKNYLTDIYLKLIQDKKHQGSKAYYIVSSTYDDAAESMSVKMLELVSTKDLITY